MPNFGEQLEEKAATYPESTRQQLSRSLEKQYKGVATHSAVRNHLDLLADSKTFTVTTGHQLNLFTGPLYFLYKIVSTIKLCGELKEAYPDNHFVPIYWMATEDHDFEEINHFSLHGKKWQWNREASGAVGRLDTEGLDKLFQTLEQELGPGAFASRLKALFRESYLEHRTLAEATRYLVNSLFGEYGLVIVDGDDRDLKQLLGPYVKDELLHQTTYNAIADTVEKLTDAGDYGIQVNPREINYFYLKDGLRERLLFQDGKYFVNDTDLAFTEEEILQELEDFPERFSPNVVTRPLYQEVILPNLCYIGGGGELAYWLQLKRSFEAQEVPFPILLLRNSALVINHKQMEKVKRLDMDVADLFMEQSQLINKKIRQVSNIDIDFSPQRKHLQEQFQGMYSLAEQTDKSFIGAVKAQEKKQLNGLDALEKRLLKAQRRKLKDHVTRITEIQNQLFPNQSLQERVLNFSELYLAFGDELLPQLFDSLEPLQGCFSIIKM